MPETLRGRGKTIGEETWRVNVLGQVMLRFRPVCLEVMRPTVRVWRTTFVTGRGRNDRL